MADPSLPISITKLSIPLGMVTTIIGGAAWLSSMHEQVNHVTQRFESVEKEFRTFKDVTTAKQQAQGEMIHSMDAKLDLMLKQLGIIERRLNAAHRHNNR